MKALESLTVVMSTISHRRFHKANRISGREYDALKQTKGTERNAFITTRKFSWDLVIMYEAAFCVQLPPNYTISLLFLLINMYCATNSISNHRPVIRLAKDIN